MVSKFALEICIFAIIAGVTMVLEVGATIPHDLTEQQIARVGVQYHTSTKFTRSQVGADLGVVGILRLIQHFSNINISVTAENITVPRINLC